MFYGNDDAIEAIKQGILVQDLVQEDLGFQIVGKGRTLTTAEHDSFTIFTNNNTWTWFSQSGAGGKALGGTVIDLYMLAHNCDEKEAIKALKARIGLTDDKSFQEWADSRPAQKIFTPKVEELSWRTEEWQRKNTAIVDNGHEELMTGASDLAKRCRDFLLNVRKLEPETWKTFKLGCAHKWNTELGQETAAVVIPWYTSNGEILRGVRYRFLETRKIGVKPNGEDRVSRKLTSASGKGQMDGGFFGTLALGKIEPESSTLIIAEGELNGCSIWQVAGGTNLDVLSLGSQGATLSDTQVEYARRYNKVMFWFDEASRARDKMSLVEGAYAIHSKHGDANDLLKTGKLGGMLTACRYKHCDDNKDAKAKLLSDLRNADNLDDGSRSFVALLTNELETKSDSAVQAVESELELEPMIARTTVIATGESLITSLKNAVAFKQWLQVRIQDSAEVLADLYEIRNRIFTGATFTIDHPHADVLIEAAKELAIELAPVTSPAPVAPLEVASNGNDLIGRTVTADELYAFQRQYAATGATLHAVRSGNDWTITRLVPAPANHDKERQLWSLWDRANEGERLTDDDRQRMERLATELGKTI